MSMLRSMLGAAALASLVLTAGACTGKSSETCSPSGRNDEIRLGLAPACEGCHLTGNKPFFASLTAFENGLVYDTRYVKPGDPENSMLVQLLEGTAPGSYPQMPPGQPYDELVTSSRVKLTIEQVKAWIRDLPPAPERLEAPDPETFTVRRLSAEEMVVSLMDQLGLTLEDFVSTSDPDWRNKAYVVNGGKFFLWPGDWAPGISGEYVSDSRSIERFEALGGGNSLLYRKRDVSFGPSAAQTLVQMSQAWCARAVDKKGNTAVLRYVTLADTSSKNPDAVQKNLRALYLRMLGQPPSEAEAKELHEQVYVPLEAQSTRLAWIGVCASLIRHPLWITY
uniref:Cytochrome C domain-containing protein n=1 Tax=Vitiosangium cumulatum TaxID=1867796 RepID=A0A7D5CHI5_9BACT|nr:cytochrome C domain-containing protein [Vitiosangium cumulatum]